MHKQFWPSWLVLLLSPAVFGASLDDISQRLVQAPIMSGEFQQQKKVKILTLPLISTGRFYLAKSKGIAWLTEAPLVDQLYINFSRQHGGDDASRLQQSMQFISGILADILSGKLTKLEAEFDIQITLLDTREWRLHLTPRSLLLAKVIEHIELSGDKHIAHLAFYEKSGNATLIDFSQQQVLAQLPQKIRNGLD